MKKMVLFIFLYSSISLAQSGDLGFKLNGISDYILLPDTDAININVVSNRTIEFWFKITDTNRRQVIYEEGDNVKAIMYYVEGGYLYLGSYTGSSTYFFRKPIVSNTWYHVAWVLNNSYISWYLNGTLQDGMPASAIPSHPGDINLGRSDGKLGYVSTTAVWTSRGSSQYSTNIPVTDGNKNFFGGNIGLFRIWSVPRTSDQISVNMNTLITDVVANPTLIAYLYDDTLAFLQSNGTFTVVSNANLMSYTWSSTASNTNFLLASNWIGGVLPDFNKLPKIIIPTSTFYPVVTASQRMGKLEVQAGARFTILPDVVIQVIYEVINNGTIRVENNGSFILRDNEDIAGTGNFEVLRNTPAYSNKYFYSYWSSPLKESSSNPATIFSGSPVIYRYNAQLNPSDWVANNGANLKPGVGYAVRSEIIGSKERTFTGKVNNGYVEVILYKTPAAFNPTEIGFNLIGNPYPSAINFQDFINEPFNEFLVKSAWFWNHQNILQDGRNVESDYYVYNSLSDVGVPSTVSGNIGTAQAFMVKVDASMNAGTAVFSNYMRVAADAKNAQFYRAVKITSESTGKMWLNLQKDAKLNTLFIGFM
ncbi:MAG: LamG domain-containing protein, partial [Flavobacteriaceae bacterium]|nr:LamG domain-containing protein [Flavobacteriaceae bacterium]